MTALQNMVEQMLGPFGMIIVVGGLGLFLILLAIPMLAIKPKDPFKRIKSHEHRTAEHDAAPLLRGKSNDRLAKFSNFLEPQDEDEFSEARKKLMQAGYRSAGAVRIYYFAQMALGLGLLALFGLMFIVTKGDDPATPVVVFKKVILPGLLGYAAPKWWVGKRQKARNELISQGFPDSLDMMLVCVEAGQSLDQAIVRVASEMRTGFPDLSDEFELVAQQMKAGKDKSQVLRDMAERVENDDVSSFVTTLIQSQNYGTPISEALRVYAAEMREKRVMRAEEKANKLPTKMTMATMMLTVPPLLLILIGPSLIDIGKLVSGNL